MDKSTAGSLPPLLPVERTAGTNGGVPAAPPLSAPPPADAAQLEPLLALLAGMVRETGRPCSISASKDAEHLRRWVDLPGASMRDAYRRAAAARGRDRDTRPVNAGFLARFVEEVLAEGTSAGASPGGTVSAWWLGGEATACAEGARQGVPPKRPDEPLPAFRVRVAKAAGAGPWIAWIVADANRSGATGFMRYVAEQLGDLMVEEDSL
ncbi:hypothetical protein WK76_24925 [Burkholderia ubonensis]|nr:hypothetical protein WK76_24925 [Burkholderia ubonensis]